MAVEVTLTMTSLGSLIFGSGTRSQRMSPRPCQASAFIVLLQSPRLRPHPYDDGFANEMPSIKLLWLLSFGGVEQQRFGAGCVTWGERTRPSLRPAEARSKTWIRDATGSSRKWSRHAPLRYAGLHRGPD